jgi:hypothetical protein
MLKGLFVLAEELGQQPHVFLESILKQGVVIFLVQLPWSIAFNRKAPLKLVRIAGVSELIRIYAGWIRRSPVLSIRIHESNHNVSVWLKKTPFTIANPFQPESVTLNLLHPDDPSRNKTLSLILTDHQQVGVENFITSKQLDEYCHSGKYYISC